MAEPINLQEAILREVRAERTPVTLFLMNGFQLRGIITGFDSFVVVLVTEGKHYNVAISHAAKKLVRLIYAMEKSGLPYRPAAT